MLLAALLAATQPQTPAQRENIVFARETRDGWSLQAINRVDDQGGRPIINLTLCQIEREGVQVLTWRHGGVSFLFGGPVRRGGEDRVLRANRLRALDIDGVPYEVVSQAMGSRTDRYSDVDYPESQTVYPPDEMFFKLSVRRRGSPLWLSIDNLTNALLRAERLRVGFRETDAAPLEWLEVPTAGLTGALAWCQAAMASPAALRFHQP